MLACLLRFPLSCSAHGRLGRDHRYPHARRWCAESTAMSASDDLLCIIFGARPSRGKPSKKRIAYPQHTLRPDQFDERVGDGGFGVALSIRREVPEITDVTFVVGGGTVGFAKRIDCKTQQSLFHTSIFFFSDGLSSVALYMNIDQVDAASPLPATGQTYSEGLHWYSHWYCLRIDECAFPAALRDHGR